MGGGEHSEDAAGPVRARERGTAHRGRGLAGPPPAATPICIPGLAALVALLFVAAAAAGDRSPPDPRRLDLVAGSIEHHPDGGVASARLAADTGIEGLVVRGAPAEVRFYSSGHLRGGSLARRCTVDGLELRAGTAFELYDAARRRPHRLRRGTLAAGQQLEGVVLPAGSELYLSARGKLLQAYVPDRATVHGVVVGGPTALAREIQFFPTEPEISALACGDQQHAGLPIPDGSRVRFDSAGRLRVLSPSRPVAVRGLELAHEIRLDEQSRLQSAWLAGDQRVGPALLWAERPLRFHPNGRPWLGWLAAEQEVGGLRLQAHSPLRLYPDGRLAAGFPAGVQRFAELRLAAPPRADPACEPGAAGADCVWGVELHANGELSQAWLAAAQTIAGARWAGLDGLGAAAAEKLRLRFDRRGRLRAGALAGDAAVDGLPLAGCDPAGACCRVRLRPSGALHSGCLARDHAADGFHFQAGSRIELHPKGAVACGTLARPVRRDRLRLPPGAELQLDAGGKPRLERSAAGFGLAGRGLPAGCLLLRDCDDRIRAVRLAKALALSERLRAAAGDFLLLDGWGRLAELVLMKARHLAGTHYPAHSRWQLDADGRLTGVVLAAPLDIQGVPCAAGETVALHPGGRLRRARLARAATIGQRRLPAGAVVELHADGRLVRGPLERTARFGAVDLQPGDLIETLYPDGALRRVVLGSSRRIDGLPCRVGTEARFAPGGRLLGCWLARPARIGGMVLRDRIERYPDGGLKRGFLARPQTLQGIALAADAVAFHPDGRIRWGRLAEAQQIQGRDCPALSLIRFDQRGRLQHTEPFAPPLSW